MARLFAGRKTPLKAALLDQSLVAGLGNIYVCEALHRAGLSPLREAAAVARPDGAPNAKAKSLAAAITAVLEEAVAAGGSTLRDHRQTDGALGYFQHSLHRLRQGGRRQFAVGRAAQGTIARIVQAGRSTFFTVRLASDRKRRIDQRRNRRSLFGRIFYPFEGDWFHLWLKMR